MPEWKFELLLAKEFSPWLTWMCGHLWCQHFWLLLCKFFFCVYSFEKLTNEFALLALQYVSGIKKMKTRWFSFETSLLTFRWTWTSTKENIHKMGQLTFGSCWNKGEWALSGFTRWTQAYYTSGNNFWWKNCKCSMASITVETCLFITIVDYYYCTI